MTTIKLEIKIIDHATPAIRRLVWRTAIKPLQRSVGPRLAKFVADYVAVLGPNKRHWPTTHFYARAARTTTWAPRPDGLAVRIRQTGMRQRYYGGPINPVNARALTIPVSHEAYGHRASEFPGVFLIHTRHGAYLVTLPTRPARTPRRVKVVRGAGFSSARRLAPLNFLFRLVSGVDQEADPNVLPGYDALFQKTMDAVNAAIWQ